MTTPAATTPAPAASTPPPAAPPAATTPAETKTTDTKATAPAKSATKEVLPEPLVSMAEPSKAADPAGSEVELPEGFDPAAGATLKSLAGQLGLDGSKAKVLIETYQKAQVAAQEKAEADFVAQAKAFTAQAAEHPVVKDLGGVQKARVLAGKALSAFGSKGLSEALTASGLAYHPEVLAAFARIGAKLGDDSVAGGSSSAAAPTSQRAQLKAIYNHPTSSSMFPKE